MKPPLAPTQMSPEELQKHLVGTYQWLRVLIAVLGALLPLALYLIGRIGSGVCLQDSLSAYYHATPGAGRTWFVGSLFAVGAMLIAYKGYTRWEDWLLNLAGIMSAGIALFPMTWHTWSYRSCDGSHLPKPPDLPPQYFNPHGLFAVTFFVCIALVCLFCADATLPLLDDIAAEHPDRRAELEARKKFLRYAYRVIGVLMLASTAGTYALHTWARSSTRIFAVESAGILSFVLYWAFKTWEMAQTEADLKTSRAEVRITNGSARVERTLPPAAR